MPAMIFFMMAGPLLFLVSVAVVILYGPKTLSRKQASELPYRREDKSRVAGGLPETG